MVLLYSRLRIVFCKVRLIRIVVLSLRQLNQGLKLLRCAKRNESDIFLQDGIRSDSYI